MKVVPLSCHKFPTSHLTLYNLSNWVLVYAAYIVQYVRRKVSK
jgi:hypothetical protein